MPRLSIPYPLRHDHGSCLAMSTGRSHDKDTLFLGRPANHAAKLAAGAGKKASS